MSRLFSRLENIGQNQAGGELPAPAPEDSLPAAVAGDVAGNPAATVIGDSDAPASAPATGAPNAAPLVPGYAILPSLAMSPRFEPVVTRPVWPVRLWLVSLLLVAGSSLLMLALPERLLPLAAQQPQPPAPIAAPAVVAPVPAASAPAMPPARARLESPGAAAAVVTAVPAARAPLPGNRGDIAAAPESASASAPPAPPRPAESTACSDAMVAMSLCSKSFP